jgi:hypothetical protein
MGHFPITDSAGAGSDPPLGPLTPALCRRARSLTNSSLALYRPIAWREPCSLDALLRLRDYVAEGMAGSASAATGTFAGVACGPQQAQCLGMPTFTAMPSDPSLQCRLTRPII